MRASDELRNEFVVRVARQAACPRRRFDGASILRSLATTIAVGLSVWTTAPSARAAEIIAVKAARLIDGTGGAPIANPVVLVESGRITAVGAGLAVPQGARVIDLAGKTLLPGLIDAHVHLTGRYVGEGSNWEDSAVRDTPQKDAIRGARNARLTLEAGFTTRNVGADSFTDIALRDMIREGIVPGPRILAAGHALGITGGHCDTNGYNPGILEGSPETGIADGPSEILKAIRTQVKRGADVIKFCATGGVLSEGDAVGVQQYTDEEMKVLVEEAHLTGRRVAAHAHGTDGIKAALRAGVDSIEHGSMLDDEAIRLFKEKGAFLVPTLMAQEAVEESAKSGVLKDERAKRRSSSPRGRGLVRKAAAQPDRPRHDSGVFPHGHNARELSSWSRTAHADGCDPRGNATRPSSLGRRRAGTIEKGKTADLVAVSGNPSRRSPRLERRSRHARKRSSSRSSARPPRRSEARRRVHASFTRAMRDQG
jgi:imidazolonepropionase-like amidohydrolase